VPQFTASAVQAVDPRRRRALSLVAREHATTSEMRRIAGRVRIGFTKFTDGWRADARYFRPGLPRRVMKIERQRDDSRLSIETDRTIDGALALWLRVLPVAGAAYLLEVTGIADWLTQLLPD
jgi:hypothetical protein